MVELDRGAALESLTGLRLDGDGVSWVNGGAAKHASLS
jgi:hypothetical protein